MGAVLLGGCLLNTPTVLMTIVVALGAWALTVSKSKVTNIPRWAAPRICPERLSDVPA
jgi:hypothetical protein